MELSGENEPLKDKIGSNDKKWLEVSMANFLKQFNEEKRANLFVSRLEKQMKKIYMAYERSDKFWRNELNNTVSTKDRVQDIYLNQTEPKVNDTYQKKEKNNHF